MFDTLRLRMAYAVRRWANRIIEQHHARTWRPEPGKTCDPSCQCCGYLCSDCGAPR